MIFENVRRLCDKNGISICALESATELGNGTIGKWKNSSPRLETLKRVAEYFGVTVDELLSDQGGE